ncbi:SAF domain-containing protein [Salinactinospora qingdaonensis]|uniref:SAF domain-containing protein n=1 Tax=Salinactinospora qingdaonensis TaxID=702744 RepID=A0ABP7FQE5_9ACTN
MAGVTDRTTAPRRSDNVSNGQAPVRLLGTGMRRWRWLAVGVGLMALGAMAVVVALGQVDQRSGVVAAARDLPAGHVVTAGDLRVVDIAGGEELAAVPSARLDRMVGQTVLRPVAQGALLTQAAVGTAAEHPGEGKAVVGAALATNQFPASLRAGAPVSVVITGGAVQAGQATPAAGEAAAPAGSPKAVAGRVQSIIPPGETGSGSSRVELVVDAGDAAMVARAAAAKSLSVVEVSPRGEQ